MNQYQPEIELYFELKGTPDSSRKSYLRRMNAFVLYMNDQNKSMEDLNEKDIQQYILYDVKKSHVKPTENTICPIRNSNI